MELLVASYNDDAEGRPRQSGISTDVSECADDWEALFDARYLQNVGTHVIAYYETEYLLLASICANILRDTGLQLHGWIRSS